MRKENNKHRVLAESRQGAAESAVTLAKELESAKGHVARIGVLEHELAFVKADLAR